MRKKLVFVVGPESGGTRGTTQLLINNGYWGQWGHAQDLDAFADGADITTIVPAEVEKVVFRRSIPHGDKYPNLMLIDSYFTNVNYSTKWLIPIRNIPETTRSKLMRKHAKDENQAIMDTIYQYLWIGDQISLKNNGVYFFNFDMYLKNPNKSIDYLKTIDIL